MARKTYESAQDRKEQGEILSAFSVCIGRQAILMPSYYPYDAVTLRGGVVSSFVEVKRRYLESTAVTYLVVSLHKWVELLMYSRETGIPAIVLFGFDDGVLAYTPITDLAGKRIIVSGRKSKESQRGDAQDIETCVCVYPNMMKRVRHLGALCE